MFPILSLLKANPIRLIGAALGMSMIIIIGLLLWRNNHLSESLSANKTAIKSYEKTINELERSRIASERVTMADREDSVANEIERSEHVGEINAQDNVYGCSSIVNDTINRLLNQHQTSPDN